MPIYRIVTDRHGNVIESTVHPSTPRPPGTVRMARHVQPQSAPEPPLGEGPGTELTEMFRELKIPGCKLCKDLARRMNAWGTEGCRQHRDLIVNDIKGRERKMGLVERMRAGFNAVLSGLAFQAGLGNLTPENLIPWMVDEAIRRAEEKQRKTADAAKEQAKAEETSGR